MSEFIEILKLNYLNIIIAVLFISCLLILYKRGKKELVQKIILSLVVQAEKTLGSGTGELKYAMVVNLLYDKLPSILRFLFTKKEIDIFIEESVNKLKDILSKNVNILGYEEEKYIESMNNKIN